MSRARRHSPYNHPSAHSSPDPSQYILPSLGVRRGSLDYGSNKNVEFDFSTRRGSFDSQASGYDSEAFSHPPRAFHTLPSRFPSVDDYLYLQQASTFGVTSPSSSSPSSSSVTLNQSFGRISPAGNGMSPHLESVDWTTMPWADDRSRTPYTPQIRSAPPPSATSPSVPPYNPAWVNTLPSMNEQDVRYSFGHQDDFPSPHQHHHTQLPRLPLDFGQRDDLPPMSAGPSSASTSASPLTPASAKPDVKECAHCHATTTPLWRREPGTLRLLCNACGLYLLSRNKHRPAALIAADQQEDEEEPDPYYNGPECTHCHSRTTSVWRRSKEGNQLCNACGVYQRMHGRARPLSLRKNKIRPRLRS
ncbi:hypothetical protein DL96DRAFT_669932 [Flagelloscypha sp. PMI_526]|nr:hypothetical protein DL96DRAFT_669932 [Flagelloscypha sp. PMI_526]